MFSRTAIRYRTAGAAIGAGSIVAGGVLGTLMVLPGFYKSTAHSALGMLWLSWRRTRGYRGLFAAGTRRAAAISIVPRETNAALGEDREWLKDQIATSTSELTADANRQ